MTNVGVGGLQGKSPGGDARHDGKGQKRAETLEGHRGR